MTFRQTEPHHQATLRLVGLLVEKQTERLSMWEFVSSVEQPLSLSGAPELTPDCNWLFVDDERLATSSSHA
jgi:hypothetical protein